MNGAKYTLSFSACKLLLDSGEARWTLESQKWSLGKSWNPGIPGLNGSQSTAARMSCSGQQSKQLPCMSKKRKCASWIKSQTSGKREVLRKTFSAYTPWVQWRLQTAKTESLIIQSFAMVRHRQPGAEVPKPESCENPKLIPRVSRNQPCRMHMIWKLEDDLNFNCNGKRWARHWRVANVLLRQKRTGPLRTLHCRWSQSRANAREFVIEFSPVEVIWCATNVAAIDVLLNTMLKACSYANCNWRCCNHLYW